MFWLFLSIMYSNCNTFVPHFVLTPNVCLTYFCWTFTCYIIFSQTKGDFLRSWNWNGVNRTVMASVYLHDTMSHAVAWIRSCGWMLSIHVIACWIVMYSHDCGHLSTWHHASTCNVACIHMTKDACNYMTSTIFHRIRNTHEILYVTLLIRL